MAKIAKKYVKSGYQHGDLKKSLLEIAKVLIQDKKHFEFTIADLAKLAGVSRAAAYRYFKSPDDILLDIACEGFKNLNKTLDVGGLDDIKKIGRSYIEFGLSHPAEYRVMFLSPVKKKMNKELRDESQYSYKVLQDSVGHSKKSFYQCTTAWSLVHGFVMLVLDGMIDCKEQGLDLEKSIDYLLDVI